MYIFYKHIDNGSTFEILCVRRIYKRICGRTDMLFRAQYFTEGKSKYINVLYKYAASVQHETTSFY